jgi:uncharacterized protein YdeI (BOF family)
MKNNRFFIARMLMALLIFALLALVVGCPSTESANLEPASLEGTWQGTRPDNGETRTIIFTGNTVHKVEQDLDYTFVQTATTITLTRDDTTFEPQTYEVKGNKLTFGPGSGHQFWPGPYTKQQ